MIRMLNCIAIFCLCFSVKAQSELSLDQCIQKVRDFATSDVAISELRYESQRIELQDAQLQFLPSVSLYSNGGMYIGRRVDPITNTFPTSAIFSNGYGVNLSVPLFSGLQNMHNVTWSKTQSEILNLNIQESRNLVIGEVVGSYYRALNLEIARKIHEQKIEQLNGEMARISELIRSDRLTKLDSINILSQIGFVKLELLEINEQLLIEQEILKVRINSEEETITLILPDTATHLMPELSEIGSVSKLLEASRAKQLDTQHKKLKQFYLPNLELFGGTGTGYSTNNLDFSVSPSVIKPYNVQLKQNFSQNIGLNLTIPLFHKGSNIRALRMSEIDLLIQEQEARKLEEELQLAKSRISAQWNKLSLSIETLSELVEYATISFQSATELYEAGRITRFELTILRNELFTAQLKYEQKVLERCRLADEIRYNVIVVN